jgi:hypothetical protein
MEPKLKSQGNAVVAFDLNKYVKWMTPVLE